MRQFMFIILCVMLIAFANTNAQNNSKIDDDNDAYAKKKKKYDLEIKYKKGMKYERNFKLKNTEDKTTQENNMQFDSTLEAMNFLKTNITILEVENDQPTELRIYFKKIKYVKNARSRNQAEAKEAEKIVGHWIKVKKYDSKNFKITETSEDYPEIDCDLIDINGLTKYAFYDLYTFKGKEISEGESFVFDYDCFMLNSHISIIDDLFKDEEVSRDLKLKLDKVKKEGKSSIAYLEGKTDKRIDAAEGLSLNFDLDIELKIEIDITKHQCRKTYFEMDFKVSIDPMVGASLSLDFETKIQIENDFSKEKQKDEVEKEKKEKKDDKD